MRNRPAAVLGLIAALVVVLAVVAAVVAATRERPALDPATPEGVVQLYLTELFDGDVAAAVEHLDPALGCTEPLPEVYVGETARLGVLSSTPKGEDGATVRLRIEEGSGFNGWSHTETFELRRDGTTWLITGEPWPLYMCEKSEG